MTRGSMQDNKNVRAFAFPGTGIVALRRMT